MASDRDPMRRQAALRSKAEEDVRGGTIGRRQVSAKQAVGLDREYNLARARTHNQRRRERSEIRAAGVTPLGRARRGVSKVTTRKPYSARGMLTAELIAGAGIVALRAVSDYEPQSDGTLKGKIGHPSGQYGPLPILAGLIGTFWLLSFLAARGGTKAKVAVIAGALVVLVLGMKSTGEMNKTAATFSTFGKAKTPAGDWQSSGTPAGEPVQGSASSSGNSSSGGSGSSGSGGATESASGPPPSTKAECEAAGGSWINGRCWLPPGTIAPL